MKNSISDNNAPHLQEKTLESQPIYDGRIISVKKDTVLLENGSKAFREVVLHPGGVCVVPLTDNGDVLMVRQFRYPYSKALLEIPAGKLEYGEDPAVCARRELLEETGCTADCFDFIGELYPSPAYLNEVIYIYLATSLHQQAQNLDEDEFLEVERIPFIEAVKMVVEGEIKDAKTQIALLKVNMKLSKK